MAEEEVELEVEALQAVYGDDCLLLEKYPPHIHVHIKPRTADVSSQQFVEAVIGMRAGPQYPEEPPHISIIDSKGLDEQRQKYLLTRVREKAYELTSCLMLVALCEDAVEQLSSMNHPDGNCPLCLYPLVDEDGCNKSLPFMKLMSCFHCFHCQCIIRWWNWLQLQKERDSPNTNLSSGSGQDRQDMHHTVGEGTRRCPVCRKVFHAKDIEHVLTMVAANSLLVSSGDVLDHEEKILHSDSETARREKFAAILKLQQEKSGLIEPKKNEVLLPGMYLPRPLPSSAEVSNQESVEQQIEELSANSEPDPRSTSSSRSGSRGRNIRGNKNKGHYSRKQPRQWIRKETD